MKSDHHVLSLTLATGTRLPACFPHGLQRMTETPTFSLPDLLKHRPHDLSLWEAQNFLPAFEYEITPRIDFLKMLVPKLPNGAVGKDGLRVMIGLGQNALTSRNSKTGKLLLTVHDPSPADVANLIIFGRRFSLARDQFWIEEFEVALDFRAIDRDPLKLPELIEWLRFFHDPKPGIQANHRAARTRGRFLKVGPDSPGAGYTLHELADLTETYYVGHRDTKYVDPNEPHVGFMRVYLKDTEQSGRNRIPLPTNQQAARIEINVPRHGLQQLGMVSPEDLRRFNFRKQLARFFRLQVPDAARRRRIKPRPAKPSNVLELCDQVADQIQAEHEKIGVRAMKAKPKWFPLVANQIANERIGDALANLGRRYRKCVTGTR